MDDTLYYEYLASTQTIEYFSLQDDLSDVLKVTKSKLKKVYEFIRDIAKRTRAKISDWIEILKNKKIFRFFQSIKFSAEEFYKKYLAPYAKVIDEFFAVISKYVAESKVGKWTTKELRKLDKFLEKHPLTKRFGGVIAFCLLIYINTQMVYVGDPIYDFDMENAIDALMGNYSLAQLFSGAGGTKLLLMLATGVLVPTFPWGNAAKFLGLTCNCLYNLYKKKYMRLHDTLSEIREQLFDADPEIKNAFNEVCEYFSGKGKVRNKSLPGKSLPSDPDDNKIKAIIKPLVERYGARRISRVAYALDDIRK